MHLIADDTWHVALTNINASPNIYKFVANSTYEGQWGDINQSVFLLPINQTADLAPGFGNDITISENISGLIAFTFNDQTRRPPGPRRGRQL